MSWITSSFDDFSTDNVNIKPARKRSRAPKTPHTLNVFTNLNQTNCELWADLYEPTIRDDLAVNKKKIQEVESWIVESLSGVKNREYLLLSGPAGCAKTATVRVLAKEAKLNIIEWVNPTSTAYEKNKSNQSYNPQDVVYETSMTNKFRQFFSNCIKFRSVCDPVNKSKNLILIEDLPNTVLRNPIEFHDILRKHKGHVRNPVIFIVSDSSNQQNNVRNLFPSNLQTELGILNIVFNGIASSFLSKALLRIVSTENLKGIPIPSKEVIQQFSDASNGDIRSAINSLQFACRKDSNELEGLFKNESTNKGTKKSKRMKISKSGSINIQEKDIGSIGYKDPNLLLFRALGKVLYSKRNEEEGIRENLPAHLKKHERYPLLENPEAIYEKGCLSSSSFSMFLHQNCLSFFTDIDKLSEAMNHFTDSDVIQSYWDERGHLDEYSASLSIRGIMHYKYGNSSSNSWKPLVKPQWYSVQKSLNNHLGDLRNICCRERESPTEVVTSLIPYKAKIKNSELSSFERTLINFKLLNSLPTEKINELDIETEIEDIPSNYHNLNIDEMTTNQHLEDELEDDFLIEEIED